MIARVLSAGGYCYMRSIPWMLVLTPVLCTPAAFALDKTSVNMPFSFETHGKVFPASQYDVILGQDHTILTLTSKTNPADTLSFATVPAGMGPNDTVLSLQFDRVGNMHELHAVRFAGYKTSVLDTRVDTLKNPVPPQSHR
jgi:hypothetical protein